MIAEFENAAWLGLTATVNGSRYVLIRVPNTFGEFDAKRLQPEVKDPWAHVLSARNHDHDGPQSIEAVDQWLKSYMPQVWDGLPVGKMIFADQGRDFASYAAPAGQVTRSVWDLGELSELPNIIYRGALPENAPFQPVLWLPHSAIVRVTAQREFPPGTDMNIAGSPFILPENLRLEVQFNTNPRRVVPVNAQFLRMQGTVAAMYKTAVGPFRNAPSYFNPPPTKLVYI